MNTFLEPPPQQKGMGCFTKGCLILLCFFALLCFAFIGGTFLAVRYLKTEYLPRNPIELPSATPSEQEQQAAIAKWEEFDKRARAHASARVEFTADELNALIAAEPLLRGKAHISLEGDIARMQVSIPLTNMRWMTDRYMNGACTVQSGMTGDPSELRITNAVINDRPVADEVLQMQYGPWSIRRFFNDWSGDENLKTVEIHDGRVILESKKE
jgi:hypothetical protein